MDFVTGFLPGASSWIVFVFPLGHFLELIMEYHDQAYSKNTSR